MCVFISQIVWNYSWFTWCICRFVGKFHVPTGHPKKTSKSRQQLEVNRGRRGLIAHVLLVRWYLETCLWWCQKAEWQKTWSFWTEQVVFSHAKNRQQPKFASKNDDVSESIVLTATQGRIVVLLLSGRGTRYISTLLWMSDSTWYNYIYIHLKKCIFIYIYTITC